MARIIVFSVFVVFSNFRATLNDVVREEDISSRTNNIYKENVKSRTFYDYQTRVAAFKDLIESRCLLEFLKNGESVISQNFQKTRLENLPKHFFMSENQLSMRQIWTIGGQRIAEFCRGFPTYLIQEVHPDNNQYEILNDISNVEEHIRRNRRETKHYFVGRVKGQTQSQYLSFGNSKDPGKAEAESTYGSSKAVVTGSSGMGQAQSQSSPYDCENCYGQRGQGFDQQTQVLQSGKPGAPTLPGVQQIDQIQHPGEPIGPSTDVRYPGEGPGYVRPQVSGPPTEEIGGIPSRGPSYPGQVIGGRPGEIISGGRPGEFINGGRPGVFISGGRPGEIISGSHPSEFTGSGRPGEIVGGHRPGDIISGGRPGDIVSGRRPGDFISGDRPGEIISSGRPAEISPYPEQVINGQPGDLPSYHGHAVSRPSSVIPSYPGQVISGHHGELPSYPGQVTDSQPGQMFGSQPGVISPYPGQSISGRPGDLSPYPGQVVGGRPSEVSSYPGKVISGRPGDLSSYPGQVVGGHPSEAASYPGQVISGRPGDTISYPGQVISGRPSEVRPYTGESVEARPGQSGYYPGQIPSGRPSEGPYYHGQVVDGQPGIVPTYPGHGIDGRPSVIPSNTEQVISGRPSELPIYTTQEEEDRGRPIPGSVYLGPGRVPQGPNQYQITSGITDQGVRGVDGQYYQKPSQHRGTFSGKLAGDYGAQTGQTGKFSGIFSGQYEGYQNGRHYAQQPGYSGEGARPGQIVSPSADRLGGQIGDYGTRQPGYQGERPGQVQVNVPTTGDVTHPSSAGIYGGGQPGYQIARPGTGQSRIPSDTGGIVQGVGGDGGVILPNYGPAASPGQVYQDGKFDEGRRTFTPGTVGQTPSGHLPGTAGTVGETGYTGGSGIQEPLRPNHPGYVRPGTQITGYPTYPGSEPYSQTIQQPGVPRQPGYIGITGPMVSGERTPSQGGPYNGNAGVIGQGPSYGQGTYSGANDQVVGQYGTGQLVEGQVDDANSQVQTSVQQTNNETQASASAQGKYQSGTAQSQVSGTYTGSGSFSASAGSDDGKRGALTQVSGGKEGALSSAQGRGGLGQSQAQVQLSSDTGDTVSSAQTGGHNHGSQTQVQAGGKGGMADAQSNGQGSTSSQAQIGFTPYDENEADNQTTPFRGGGMASAQSGTFSGQSQSQIQGKFRYGIKYVGAAQAGSGSKEAIALARNQSRPEGLSGIFPPFKPLTFTSGTQNSRSHQTTSVLPKNHMVKSEDQLPQESGQGEMTTILSTPEQPETNDDYNDEYEETDYEGDDATEKPVPKSIITQKSKHQRQHIILDPLEDLDATVHQSSGDFPREGTIIQPGQSIPGSGGYRIPKGFRGKVKSIASGSNTYTAGQHSQAQSVTLTPGTGKIIYRRPVYSVSSNTHFRNGHVGFGSGYTYQPIQYQVKSGKSLPNFISVAKSETGSKNLSTGKKTPAVYYTQSSSCGVFTNTCVFNNSGKLCFPKAKTNPDGTLMGC